MFRRTLVFASIIAVVSLASSHIHAQVNITDGTSQYIWNPAAPQSTQLNDQFAGNVMFEDMWIVRFTDSSGLGGSEKIYELDGTVDAFGVQFTGTTNSGDNATSTWNINGEGGAAGPLFQVALTHTISTSSAGNAVLTHNMVLQNFIQDGNIVQGSDLDLFLFNDFDLPNFGDNSVSHNLDGTDRILTMTSDINVNASTIGFDASFFQIREVGAGTRLSTAVINGEIVNLDNSGSPLNNADINSMFQWDTIVPIGAGGTFSANVLTAVPEPGTAGLISVLGMVGLCVLRRRRK